MHPNKVHTTFIEHVVSKEKRKKVQQVIDKLYTEIEKKVMYTITDSNEIEAILAHELAHIIRRDFSMNIFFTLIEILFYYHPGVWLMAATIRSEREHCCDDLALFLCKNPLAYARALYKLEAAYKAARLPGLALSLSTTILFTKQDICILRPS